MNRALLLQKLKEALFSILPVSLITFLLTFIPSFDFNWSERFIFLGAVLTIIVGITLFSLGADMGLQPMGGKIGSSLMRTKRIWIVVLIVFILGVLVTVAEPDLSMLASQVETVFGNKNIIIYLVGLGVGLFLVFGVLKIIFKKDLTIILLICYFILFSLIALVMEANNKILLPLSFDSGGVTTGPITVPFLMALGLGVATTIGGRDQKQNSFGLVALCSIGPIVSLLILSIKPTSSLPVIEANYSLDGSILNAIFNTMLINMKEVLLALILILASFLVVNYLFIKLTFKRILEILVGLFYTFVGLVLFLTAAHVGFMPTGYKLGMALASVDKIYFIIFSVLIGGVVVIAEPAIHVLTKQVEDITTGGVSRRGMLIALAIGNALAILMSYIRIIYQFSILYYLIPGYIIAIGLSLFVPKIYTAIAFDSGGVASGPLTTSLILPLAIGTSITIIGDSGILEYAFGVVALVAMMPLIVIQVLGFRFTIKKIATRKSRAKKIVEAIDDEKIIVFEGGRK